MINRWHCPLRKIGEQDYRQIYKANSPNGKKRRQNHGACSSVWHADLCACSISPAVWRRSIGRMSALSGKYRTIVSQPESQRAVSSNRGGGDNGPQESCGRLPQNLPFGVQEEESRPDCGHMKRWNSCRGKGNVFCKPKMQNAGSFLLEKPRAAFHAFSFPIVPKAPGTSYFFAEKEAVAQLSFCNSPYFMDFPGQQSAYLANSVLRVSRITLTRIWPGYSISFSMRLAISLARIWYPHRSRHRA